MKISDQITIIVNTCDAYQDVLQLFLCALNEYWRECDCRIIINTESNRYDFNDSRICVFNYCKYSGTDRWGDRVRNVLKSIDSEFVLMLYDDFILENHIDLKGLYKAIDLLLIENKASAIYLINTALPIEKDDRHLFLRVKEKSDFIVNSAPAIWRKKDLMSYIGENDNPWAWEVFGSYRAFSRDNIFYTLNPKNLDIFPYNYKKGGAIYRGKWVKDVVDGKFQKYNLNIDPTVRGFINLEELAPRNFRWKLDFMLTGFNMVGVKAFYFIFRYLKIKAQLK